jgi:hypothetical protein
MKDWVKGAEFSVVRATLGILYLLEPWHSLQVIYFVVLVFVFSSSSCEVFFLLHLSPRLPSFFL